MAKELSRWIVSHYIHFLVTPCVLIGSALYGVTSTLYGGCILEDLCLQIVSHTQTLQTFNASGNLIFKYTYLQPSTSSDLAAFQH